MNRNTPNTGGESMSGLENQEEGRFRQFTGRAKEVYGDLNDDWAEQFNGNMEQAKGWLQERYGNAQEQLSEFWNDGEQADETRRAA